MFSRSKSVPVLLAPVMVMVGTASGAQPTTIFKYRGQDGGTIEVQPSPGFGLPAPGYDYGTPIQMVPASRPSASDHRVNVTQMSPSGGVNVTQMSPSAGPRFREAPKVMIALAPTAAAGGKAARDAFRRRLRDEARDVLEELGDEARDWTVDKAIEKTFDDVDVNCLYAVATSCVPPLTPRCIVDALASCEREMADSSLQRFRRRADSCELFLTSVLPVWKKNKLELVTEARQLRSQEERNEWLAKWNLVAISEDAIERCVKNYEELEKIEGGQKGAGWKSKIDAAQAEVRKQVQALPGSVVVPQTWMNNLCNGNMSVLPDFPSPRRFWDQHSVHGMGPNGPVLKRQAPQ